MKKLLLDIFYVWLNELHIIIKDKAVIILFFLVPIGYPLLYSFIYTNEVVREVKVVVMDESNTALSREFRRKVDASPDVQIVGYASSLEDAKTALDEKEAYGIYYIPNNFSRNMHRGEQTEIILYADMSSLLFYKAMFLAANEVSLDMGAQLRGYESGHISRQDDVATMYPVVSEWVPLYNVPNGFASFFVPAVLILIIQQTLLLGISTIVGTHTDKKRFTMASHTAAGRNVGAIKLTIGKAFCYSSLYMVMSVWVLRIVPNLFSLPQIGDPIVLIVFLMPFLLSATFFCMTLSYFSSEREFSVLLFVFTSVLFIFLTGVSWPWISIPEPLKAIAYILPSTSGVHGFIKINTMGASLSDVWPEYIRLWVLSAIYCVTAILMYIWWIKNYDPKYLGMSKKMLKQGEEAKL